MKIDLDEEQHDDMCRVAGTIDETETINLKKSFAEGDAYDVGGILKEK